MNRFFRGLPWEAQRHKLVRPIIIGVSLILRYIQNSIISMLLRALDMTLFWDLRKSGVDHESFSQERQCNIRVKATYVLRLKVGGYFCVWEVGFEQQLGKQRLDLFPPKGRLGAGPARASRGQGGPQGAASRGQWAGGCCPKGRRKEAGGRPAHSLDPLRCKWWCLLWLLPLSAYKPSVAPAQS